MSYFYSLVSSNAPVYFSGNKDRKYTHLRQGSGVPGDNYGVGRYSQNLRQEHSDFHLQQILHKKCPFGSNILELGCNNGNNLVPLAKDYNVYGLDIHEHCLENAHKYAKRQGLEGKVHLEQWDFAENGDTPWPEKKGQWQAIFATHTLSHLKAERLIPTIQSLKEHLAPGGLFIVTMIEKEEGDVDGSIYAGTVSHTKEEILEAFDGLILRDQHSRPFHPNEVQRWKLPNDRLRWYVFQKPHNWASHARGCLRLPQWRRYN